MLAAHLGVEELDHPLGEMVIVAGLGVLLLTAAVWRFTCIESHVLSAAVLSWVNRSTAGAESVTES